MKIRFDAPPAGTQQSNGLAVRYAAAKREVPRWRWYLMVLLISLPIFYFAAPIIVSVWWHTAPGLVLLKVVTIKAPADGQVSQLVKEGTVVQAGAALAVIQPLQLASTVAMGEPLLLNLPPTAAGASSAPASAGQPSASPSGSADAQTSLLQDAVKLAQREVGYRRHRLAVLEDLRREGASTRAEIDAARAQLAQAESTLLRARLDWTAQIRQLQQSLQLQQSRLAMAAPSSTGTGAGKGRVASGVRGTAGENPGSNAQAAGPSHTPWLPPALAVATSPFAGKVTSVLAVQGESVTPASELLVIHGEEAASIEAFIRPDDADLARKGRRAVLRFFDGGRIGAEVIEVETQAGRLPADRVSPLSPRSQAIVVRLKPDTPLPEKYQIHQLPLNVRFEWRMPWES